MQSDNGEYNLNFGEIWNWHPERLNRFSSVWWYFILFPEGSNGYGPQQIMFTVVSVGGELVRINHVPHQGFAHTRTPETAHKPIPGMALGWLYDGETMHDRLLQNPCQIRVNGDYTLSAWDECGYGGEIAASDERSFAADAYYRGERGEARFHAWGDPSSAFTVPEVANRYTSVGDANVVAWRHLNFAGEFTTPAGTRDLSGVGYFQRVCLNIPPFPWKWIWARFADDSIFSCFVPFVGLHLLRRGDWFFPGWLENLTVPIQPSGYFCRGGTWQNVEFSRVEVRVQLGRGPYPDFQVACYNEDGDFLQYRALSYAHAQVLLDRPLVGQLHSRYNYNEYLFRVEDLSGVIAGEPVDGGSLGQGYGNCEYTWGAGL